MRITPCGLAASAALVAFVGASAASAQWIPTNAGSGADAEVREAFPSDNRGASTELATRVQNEGPPPGDGGDRNSLIYTRFDLSTVSIPPVFQTAFRLTYRNTNLTEPRIQDPSDPSVRTGLSVYGLNPMATGVAWGEATINYANAPGITPDGDIGTRDLNPDLTLLGTVEFPEIGNQNWLPVGGALVFQSPALDQFVADALAGGASTVTLVSHVTHDGTAPFSAWINFNYLFNPKEQTTLNADPNYDSDTSNPANPLGSPWSAADNSSGDFSPALLIQQGRTASDIPAASTLGVSLLIALMGCAGWVLLRLR